jgi:superfamily II DNA or RNA helicase
MKITDINNSYCLIESDLVEVKQQIGELLSVYLPNYQFLPQVRAGISDGKKRFYQVTKDGNLLIPSGLKEYIKGKLNQLNIDYELEDIEQKYKFNLSDEDVLQFVESLNLPFKPYDYQLQAFKECVNAKRLIVESATGSGKSLIISLVLMFFFKQNLKQVLIVPNINLLEQFISDIKEYQLMELAENIHLIGGDNKIKHFDKQVTITTWQSTHRSQELYKEIDVVLVDEAHLAKGNKISEILQSSLNCEYKLGFSGSLNVPAVDKMALLSTLGYKKNFINAKGLIERGLATPVLINCLFLMYDTSVCKDIKHLKYPDEVKYFEEYKARNEFLTNLSISLSKKYGNGLVLFNHTKHGIDLWNKYNQKVNSEEETYDLTKTKYNSNIDFMKERNTFLVYGNVKGSIREEIRHLLSESNNSVVFANFSTFSTGVNIKNLHWMILASSTKSGTKIVQSIGRGMRLHHSKEIFRIFDIADDATYKTKRSNKKNYLMKHFDERLQVYLYEGHEINEKEIYIRE